MPRRIFNLCLILILSALIVSGAAFIYIFKSLPDPSQLNERQLVQSTKIYDRTGNVLLYEIHGEEKRTVVPYEEIPEYVKRAAVAIEDQNFYQHPAFDWRAILRALITDIIKGHFVQGGSTITQQLAKNSFLTSERTIIRKIKEIILSVRLERTFSKDQILYLYLNQIPYGANAYGIEAASQTYFNKSAKDLTLAEAALLAALPKAPTYYSPWGSHIDELKDRQKYVLEQMFQLGFIDEEELKRAQKAELYFAPQSTGKIKAPHFVIAVQDYLIKKYGEDIVERGGLKVTTTLDWDMQQLAEKVVAEGAARNEELYEGKNAALVAQDAPTGQVLAMVGSRDYFDIKNEGNFNVATQGLRQPGSAFKPFAYLTAFKKGYAPDTVVFDAPTEFDSSGNPERSYHPNNFDEKFRGPLTFRQALAQSINVPSVKVLYLAGIDDALATARDLGITTLTERSRYGLSLVLGGGEVKLNELVEAYSVFAREGEKHDQTMILKTEDSNGNVLEEYRDDAQRVVDPQPVRLLNDILTDDNARRPLYQNSFDLTVFPGHQVALKTGTTNDYRDAWAIGYTPSLVVGVWAGNNNNQPMQRRGSSILAAVPIWHAFLDEILKNKELETFSRPDPISLPAKPMLDGKFASDGAVHSILYYVNKNDPLGPAPYNPSSDPQFENWEKGVSEWVRSNGFVPQNMEEFSTTSNPKPPGVVNVEFISPKNGDFISDRITVLTRIDSSSEIVKIELYFNGKLTQQLNGDIPEQKTYEFNLMPSEIQPQNILTLKVLNSEGAENEATIIVFR
ncbi:MAG: PBP1A family penicillin-binding protein [Parcubacteria group bacterium]|nr:PBP1A family penicillin-binding protein [Parcubacteria group bacterium]